MAQILYQDEHIVAASKPPGQAVIPGRGLPAEPLNVELSRRLGGRLWVVHRIDREASGLVVFARDAATHRALCAAFEGRAVRKVYLALAQGQVRDGGSSEPLREFGSGRSAPASDGKPSQTLWRALRGGPRATLLEVEPKTGRRHQIRVHLHHAGHPLLGDPRYGKPRPVGGCPRLMLHALELRPGVPGLPEVLRAEPDAAFAALCDEFTRPEASRQGADAGGGVGFGG